MKAEPSTVIKFIRTSVNFYNSVVNHDRNMSDDNFFIFKSIASSSYNSIFQDLVRK